jgi:hypothetical protein
MRGTRIRTITKLLFPNHDIHMFISISHFSFFCGISTGFYYNYHKGSKSFVKVKYFFLFFFN